MINHSTKPLVRFCAFCGKELDLGAKFCKGCGVAVEDGNNLSRREIVYEGHIHKCPNCGEVMDAFATNCPSCGYEIRGTKTTFSAKEFEMRLERIESEKMPVIQENRSLMEKIFGNDFKDDNEINDAQKRFEAQKGQEKASLIINFPVPNTREDMLEFIILATSNINVKHGVDDVVTKAWISKLEQVYKKAKLSMGETQDFSQIREIYSSKKMELNDRKFKKLLFILICIVGFFLLLGFCLDTVKYILIAILCLAVGIAGSILYVNRRSKISSL